METIEIALPTEIISAIRAEANKCRVSADAVASILLVSEVTHTLIGNRQNKANGKKTA